MNHLTRKVDKLISKLVHKIWNPYNLNLPRGNCPVQAEGYLPTGEFYYFRSRWSTWSMDFCKSSRDWDDRKFLYQHIEKDFCEQSFAGWISTLHGYILMNRATRAYLKTKHEQHSHN
jgi:hypothetical protein